MNLRTVASVTGAVVLAAGVVAFPTAGNATCFALNDSEMDQISAGYNNLTGIWEAISPDGGTYYMRQIGNVLYWYGEKFEGRVPTWPNGGFSNVGYGTINADTGVVRVSFAGVPKTNDGGSGTLRLRIAADSSSMMTIGKGGANFGGTPGQVAFRRL